MITIAQSSILQVTAWYDVLVFLATDMAEALLELEKDVFIQIIINSYWLTNRKLSWGVLDVVQVFLAVVQVDQDMVHVLGDINKVFGDLLMFHAYS